MYQTRASLSKKIPLPRKGTKYVARSLIDLENSVPVVVAVRDMLNLAKTKKEVEKMIQQKLLKINGREVKDHKDSIRLFNLFEADKNYMLTFTAQGKFMLEETKLRERPCKVINKTMTKGKKMQVNLHDGTNVLSEDKKIQSGDTVYINSKGEIAKHIPFEKGKGCLVISGKFLGWKGKVESIEEEKVKIKLTDIETVLEKKGVIVL